MVHQMSSIKNSKCPQFKGGGAAEDNLNGDLTKIIGILHKGQFYIFGGKVGAGVSRMPGSPLKNNGLVKLIYHLSCVECPGMSGQNNEFSVAMVNRTSNIHLH